MRYWGGSEGSREGFSIQCIAVQKSLTQEGRYFNCSPEKKMWLNLWNPALVWTELHTALRYPTWTIPQRSGCTFLITPVFTLGAPSPCREKNTKRHEGTRMLGQFKSCCGVFKCVCATGEDCHPGTPVLPGPADSSQTAGENRKTVELYWSTGTLCFPTDSQLDIPFLWW